MFFSKVLIMLYGKGETDVQDVPQKLCNVTTIGCCQFPTTHEHILVMVNS